MFNLPAPLGFRGLDPNRPVRIYYRHLPHWRQDGATYFVTFRLNDALPQSQLQFLKRLRLEWERTHPEPRSEDDWERYAQDVTRRTEAWLDEGYGACYFRDARWSDDLQQRLMHCQGQRYHIGSSVVMPNHCHLIIRPFEGFALEDQVGAMKAITAKHVNAAVGRTGDLWQQESYDRIIRDEEHLWRCLQYIGRNPANAGLLPQACRLWVDPDWVSQGWGFKARNALENVQ